MVRRDPPDRFDALFLAGLLISAAGFALVAPFAALLYVGAVLMTLAVIGNL